MLLNLALRVLGYAIKKSGLSFSMVQLDYLKKVIKMELEDKYRTGPYQSR